MFECIIKCWLLKASFAFLQVDFYCIHCMSKIACIFDIYDMSWDISPLWALFAPNIKSDFDMKTRPLRPKSGRPGHFPDRRDMSQIHFINALEKATTNIHLIHVRKSVTFIRQISFSWLLSAKALSKCCQSVNQSSASASSIWIFGKFEIWKAMSADKYNPFVDSCSKLLTSATVLIYGDLAWFIECTSSVLALSWALYVT